MKFVDAHIHLSDEEYSTCVPEIVAEAQSLGVVALVSNSENLKTSLENLKLAENHPGFIYAALGTHPSSVEGLTEEELDKTLELIKNQKCNKAVIAVGEIGLDSKYMQTWKKQMNVFDSMLHLAEELNLPVIIHSRGTTARIVDMLPSYKVKRTLLHWFSDPSDSLSKAVSNGYYISEGVPTVYASSIREIVKKVPLANLLTETDGPVHFNKPPFKGKKTTPAFIPQVVNAMAEIKRLKAEEVAEQIIINFQQFFNLQLEF